MSDSGGVASKLGKGLRTVWILALLGVIAWALYETSTWYVPAGGAGIGAVFGMVRRSVSPYDSRADLMLSYAGRGAMAGLILVFVYYGCSDPARYQDIPHPGR